MFKKVKYGEKRYYLDEYNDDFVHTKTNIKITVDGSYKYLSNNLLYNIYKFVLYYFFAIPILFVFGYVFKGVRVKGRQNIKKLKNQGYLIYGNHTNIIDSFIGHVFIARPKMNYIISNKDALSIKFVKHFTKLFGALPVPDTTNGLKNLNIAISKILKNKKAITVYPEAHIWHYYTGLRPFSSTSFRFAASNNVPAVPVAVTYRKPRGLFKSYKRPAMTINIGEPIYPNLNYSVKENQLYLQEEVYKYIKEKVSSSDNFPLYEYVKKGL